jgi:hypothetical protein
MYEEEQLYDGPEDYWLGIYENSYNPTVYQGIKGHVHHSRDTWGFAQLVRMYGHYRDQEYHVFYEGKECHPFPSDREYMSDHEIFECLLSAMKFHHIWDDLGFDFSF